MSEKLNRRGFLGITSWAAAGFACVQLNSSYYAEPIQSLAEVYSPEKAPQVEALSALEQEMLDEVYAVGHIFIPGRKSHFRRARHREELTALKNLTYRGLILWDLCDLHSDYERLGKTEPGYVFYRQRARDAQ